MGKLLLLLGFMAAVIIGSFVYLASAEEGQDSAKAAHKKSSKELSRPNVIVITTDDQTMDEMRFLPRTRSLFSAGRRFANFYAATPLCCPSRASFLTGRYSHNHGVLDNGGANGGWKTFRQNEQDTLPVWMQSAGYETSWIGKYMNGYDLSKRPEGWSNWFAKDSNYDEALYGKAMYYNYKVLVQDGTNLAKIKEYGASSSDYQTKVFTRRAVSQIQERNKNKPLFLSLAYSAPHSPTIPAREDIGSYSADDMPPLVSYNERDVSDKNKSVAKLPELKESTEKSLLQVRMRRAEMLRSVDRGVARIMQTLQEEGMMESTYVIFTSDNGFFFGQHRISKGKGFPYLPASSVPLLVRGPEVVSGVESRVASNVDLAPTIAKLAGAAPSLYTDGRSIVPLLKKGGKWPRKRVLVESLSSDTKDGQSYVSPPYTALAGQKYFYIRFLNGEEELYNLQRDPHQLRSIKNKKLLAIYRKKAQKLQQCQAEECSRF